MRRSLVALIVTTAPLALLGGCEGLLGIDGLQFGGGDGAADATSDAAGDVLGSDGDARAPEASSDVMRGGDGTDAEASAGPTVYVSAGGNDTYSGLDPMHPKRTIVAGLSLATTLPGLPTVEVCAGPSGTPYLESLLTVGQDVQLLGGWDCTFQTRNPSAYPTLVKNGAPSQQNATLLVTLSAVASTISSKTVIDGFIIDGGPAGSVSMGVSVTGKSVSPVLSNDIINGGAGTGGSSDNWASVGLHVANGATPEITGCTIHGGSGSGSAIGSAGIAVEQSGDPNIHQDVVSGGSGTGGTGSVGINLTGGFQLSHPVDGVLVYGNDDGEPSDAGAFGSGLSVGILLNGNASATIESSIVLGGESSGPTRGVDIEGAGTVRLTGNRIYGGDSSGAASSGVQVGATNGPLTIVNSEIHPGTSSSQTGISLTDTMAPTIEDSTIYAGQGAAINVSSNVGQMVIRNDLLLGASPTGSGILSPNLCFGMIASLDNTGFLNLGLDFACQQGELIFTASNMVQLSAACMQLTFACASDVEVVSDDAGVPCPDGGCVSDPTCPGTASTCLGSIFGSWTNDGTNIFSPPAVDGGTFSDWAALSQYTQLVCGGIGQMGVSTDLLGNPRSTTAATSMGAVVTTSSACPQ